MKYIECDGENALEYIKKYNVFMTGPPGSGKTHVIKQYIEYCTKFRISAGITASTGVASKLISGATIHSFAGIDIVERTDSFEKILDRVQRKPKIVSRWKRISVLILDEISLLDGMILVYLDKIAQIIRNNNAPFGGIRILLVGDFFQLPPINGEFCFMTTIWEDLFNYGIQLNHIYRSVDNRLNRILRTIRKGHPLKPNMIRALEQRINTTEVYPILVPLREMARNINERKMIENMNTPHVFNAIFSENCNDSIIKKMVLNNSPLEETLILKKGCPVINLVNDNTRGLVNGSIGIVVDIIHENVVVQFDGKNYIIEQHTWKKEHDNKHVYMTQFPLLVSFSITIHRCQGMTLSHATMVLDSNIFASGQAYVALSRITCLKSLNLLEFDPHVFIVNKSVLKYYKKFKKID